MKIAVAKISGGKAESIELSDDIFAFEPRVDIMSRVVNWQLAKKRNTSHAVKTRSDINAVKSKMYKQKGTGNARHGAKSVVQFKGGGVAHGPVERNFNHSLTKKIRAIGLKSAISSRAKEGNVIVIDKLESDGKTSSLISSFSKLGIKSALIVDEGEASNEFIRALSNVPNVNIIKTIGVNVYDILKHNQLVLTKLSLIKLQERFK